MAGSRWTGCRCPEPGPGELLVEVAACGICGSDLHLVLEQYARPGPSWGTSGRGPWWPGTTSDRSVPPGTGSSPTRPRVAGAAGRVGGAVRRSACRRDVLRPPGHAWSVRSLPGGAGGQHPPGSRTRSSMRAAALAEPTAIALHAVELSRCRSRRPGPGDRGRTDRPAHRLGPPGPGDQGHHRQRAVGSPPGAGPGGRAPAGPSDPRSWPSPRPAGWWPDPVDVAFECSGSAAGGRAGPGQPGPCRDSGLRGHRTGAGAGQPQPDDHPRARGRSGPTTTAPRGSSPPSTSWPEGHCPSTSSSNRMTCPSVA